jgi:hypothetical protein
MTRGTHLLAGGTLLLGLMAAGAFAQENDERSLEETLSLLSGDAAAQYVAPISSSFGANLNSGWFHRAPGAKKLGFNFEAGVVAMGSFFPDDANHFDVQGQFRFSASEANLLLDFMEESNGVDIDLVPGLRTGLVASITAEPNDVGISGATVIGAAADSITIAYDGGTYSYQGLNYAVPAQSVKLPVGGFGDLADISLLPLMAPQLTVGTVWGTQFTLRYLPAVELNAELGEFKYSGFGIQHNPAVWLDMKLPVDLAASFFTQKMEVGSLFECSSTAMGLNASKTIGWRFLNLTPYAGFMWEDASMKVNYDFIVEIPDTSNPGQTVQDVVPISLDLASENSSRLTAGLNVRVGIINWNVDYSMAKYAAISTGVTVAF